MPEMARELIALTVKAQTNLIALIGDLGAGKTSITQEIATSLGIKENIQSPTFVLMTEYDLPPQTQTTIKRLIHIDAYRIDRLEEATILDLNTLLKDKNNLVVIEWADKIAPILPKHYLEVQIKEVEDKREFKIKQK